MVSVRPYREPISFCLKELSGSAGKALHTHRNCKRFTYRCSWSEPQFVGRIEEYVNMDLAGASSKFVFRRLLVIAAMEESS
jgi:hypothetical protein